jgi:DNA primase
MSTIDDIKTRLDIVETVGHYVSDLKKSGRTYKARCPFHSERTPSFVVDPDRGTWHCFGACSTGGDVIEFVRRIEGLEFKEALRVCAERAGVELRPPSKREVEEREEHERLLQANEAAAVFFQAALAGPQGAAARAYLEGRGLDAATIETWQLGYAPEGWRSLTDHLVARGFAEHDLVAAGLAIEGDRGAYDRFRDRVVFPTRDARRRLIGFGARALRPEDEPKYLNTPQTPLFDKSGNLYGLDRAADAIRRADRAVIVEGYMDVIAAHQYGVTNVVASNGTAITEKQMALLKRYTENVVLALDADTAGSEATLRGIQVAAGAADHMAVPTIDWRGLVSVQDVLRADIRVVSLPAGDDPDSLVRRDPDAFKRLVDGALPVADHLFQAVSASIRPGDAMARSKALQTLVPTVAAMSDPVIRSDYVQKLARIGQVDESIVMRMLARGGRPRPVDPRGDAAAPGGAGARVAAPADGETQLLRVLVQRRECRGAGKALAPETFEDSRHRALFEWWAASPDYDDRVDELEDDLQARYRALAAAPLPDFEARHLDDMVRDMATRLRLTRTQRRLQATAIEQAEAVRALRRRAADAPAVDAPADTEVEPAEIAEQFLETTSRQRELTHQYRQTVGRYPASVEAGPDREEGTR